MAYKVITGGYMHFFAQDVSNVNFQFAKREQKKQVTYSTEIRTTAEQLTDAIQEVQQAVSKIEESSKKAESGQDKDDLEQKNRITTKSDPA